MVNWTSAVRLMVFLTEDDRVDHRPATDVLLRRAHELGISGATVWRGVEGFGRSGHVRAARLPDLARGLPLVLDVIDGEDAIETLIVAVADSVPGALVVTQSVRVSHGS